MLDLRLLEDRKKLATLAMEHCSSVIATDSKKEDQIFEGKIKEHVKADLESQFDVATVKTMPLVHSINMNRRVVEKEASIYRQEPVRSYSIKNTNQKDAIDAIYKSLRLKQKMTRANRVYKNSQQAFLQVLHNQEKQKLELRILKRHQCFVYAKDSKPTEMDIFVTIGGKSGIDDSWRFGVWSKDYNFIMDENGAVLSINANGEEDLVNPLGVIPVIDISDEDRKQGIPFATPDHALIDFTIQLNVALTDLFHIMRQQGYAIPIIKGPASVLDSIQSMKVGITRILKLPTDHESADGKSAEVDFSFVSANPNLTASIETISTLLSAFLSSRGVDPKTVNFSSDAKSFTSGWERFLALIESFEASQDDIGLFKEAEEELFDIIIAYHNAFCDDPTKLKKYFTSSKIDLDEIDFSIAFAGPEMVETRKEKLERLNLEESSGLISIIMKVQNYFGMSEDEAVEHLKKVRSHSAKLVDESKVENV